jgi:hypothetical protein
MSRDTGNADQPLLEYGMTEEEVKAWNALARVAGAMLALPVLHPMEQQEVASDFHRLQLRLLARPGLRAAGWPREQEPR